MLQNWLKPLARKDFAPELWEKGQIGGQIARHLDGLPDLSTARVVLIGVEPTAANAVRKALYTLQMPAGDAPIADLGNARKKDIAFLIPLLAELQESNLLPVLIGPGKDLVVAQYKAFLERQQQISLVVVDQKVPVHPLETTPASYLNPLVQDQRYKLFYLGVIGAQAHLSAPASFGMLESQLHDCIRLGTARSSVQELEPIVRNADVMAFQLSALKASEAPGQHDPWPTGFFLEEACQIAWYGGMSDKLKAFGVHGFSTSGATGVATAQAAALVSWYFMDGFLRRKEDFPVTTEGLTEYIVDQKQLDHQLTFWKSKRSGRWWVQVPVRTKADYERHRLIPCSYNDYKLATQNELPDRLFNAFKRFH
jgi:formiminoglutamase